MFQFSQPFLTPYDKYSNWSPHLNSLPANPTPPLHSTSAHPSFQRKSNHTLRLASASATLRPLHTSWPCLPPPSRTPTLLSPLNSQPTSSSQTATQLSQALLPSPPSILPPKTPAIPHTLPLHRQHAVTLTSIQHNNVSFSSPQTSESVWSHIAARGRLRPLPPIPISTQQTIAYCVTHMFHEAGRTDLLSPDLLQLLCQARKGSTLHNHAGYFSKWCQYANLRRLPILPIDPFELSGFLVESSRDDTTASPTANRSAAISFMCNLAGVPNPMLHVLSKMVKESIIRSKGFRGLKKQPLSRDQVESLIQHHLALDKSLSTICTCFRMSLMYEGCLRWHDIAQLTFGDIAINQSCFRLFVPSAKSDKYRQGQWVTIARLSGATTSFSLLLTLLDSLSLLWANSSQSDRQNFLGKLLDPVLPLPLASHDILPLACIPLCFRIQQRTSQPRFDSVLPYHSFLSTLKKWATYLSIDPDDIGTHSLRRGLASDWALLGVPDRVRMTHGRWRSLQVADGYIDESVEIQLRLQAFQQPTQTSSPSLAMPHTLLLPSTSTHSPHSMQIQSRHRLSTKTPHHPHRHSPYPLRKRLSKRLPDT